MFLGSNLQYLRKITGAMTQERLAEQMGVSRQTVSKWESGEAYPELPKLMDLCEIFHCKLDDLLRQDMPSHASTYYPVRIIRVAGFRRAQYVMVSPNPEDDVNAYMDAWAKKQGLLDVPGAAVKKIGWDFPYVSGEQKNRFGLRGYVCAYVLPEDLEVLEDGVQIIRQETADYAVMTIRDPFVQAFDRIPQAYRLILEYLSLNGYKKKFSDKILPCFELVYEKDGIPYMDVFIHCDSAGQYSQFLQFT